ncbi:MAG: ATP-binding cassette domain-containing protein [Anaerolineaceae bacterium]|nr:ATP-binding cassette domain-containing protein [Anaerolineaceae bacterium]
MPVIKVEHISKSFADIQAVEDISFSLAKGEILGLIGPNGAGKTTTIRMILDIFKPDRGSISILGGPMNEEKKDLIGYLPEERGLYQDITLEKCLSYLASVKGMDKASIEENLTYYLKQFGLSQYRKKKVKDLSKGMQQKAQLIATFIHQPKLVIVDEPFSALDPVNTQIVKQLLFKERDKGTAIMMSTHQMNQAEETCSRITLINEGKVVLKGNLEEVRKRFSKPELIVTSLNWIPEDIPGVKSIQKENQQLRIKIHRNYDPKDILAEMIRREVMIEHFEVAVPNLNEIFIDVISNGAPK